MFAAMVRSSSESVGDSVTILLELLDDVAHQGFKARRCRRVTSSRVSISAVIKGSDWEYRTRRTRLYALRKKSGFGWACATTLLHSGQRSHGMQIGWLGCVQARIQLPAAEPPIGAPRPKTISGSIGSSSPGPPSAAVIGMRKQDGIPDGQHGTVTRSRRSGSTGQGLERRLVWH